MKYDDQVPALLKREQQWFGSIISRPIDEDSRMNPVSPSGNPMEVEAAEHIAPSPTLRSAQRIQIYNQQYWWRLLNTLHDIFPLMTRLFGYHDFNRTIAIPYIAKYPPRHWSLTLIGDRMEKWIDEDYHAVDKELVKNAAAIDWAFTDSFLASEMVSISTQHLSDVNGDIADKTLFLQPYIHLFEFDCDFFRYRVEFLKHAPEYWLDNEFPKLDRDQPHYFVLFRNFKNDITWKEVTLAEYRLLKLFQLGTSIDQACQWLELQDDEICDAAMQNLQLWFQEWTGRRWLSLQNPGVSQASHPDSSRTAVLECP